MNARKYRRRRSVVVLIFGLASSILLYAQNTQLAQTDISSDQNKNISATTAGSDQPLAFDSLAKLNVKGRAPKTGYERSAFGSGWMSWKECDTRQRILARDLTDTVLGDDGCTVLRGVLDDPYTGERISFKRGSSTSSAIQIDHVVALSDAWQKGAQTWDENKRKTLANDDLELMAVDGSANQQKSDGDAATWLPSNKIFRCQYVARQIAVKIKYELWVTQAEHDAMARVLGTCPTQQLPTP